MLTKLLKLNHFLNENNTRKPDGIFYMELELKNQYDEIEENASHFTIGPTFGNIHGHVHVG